MLLAAMAVATARCSSDDDNDAPGRGTGDSPIEMKFASGEVTIDDYERNIGRFSLYLESSDTGYYDNASVSGTRAFEPKYEDIIITFFSELTEDRRSFPKSGTYRVSHSEEKMTFLPGYWEYDEEDGEKYIDGSAYLYAENFYETGMEFINGGMFTIEATGNSNYIVTTSLITDKGRKLHFRYSGWIAFDIDFYPEE